MLCDVCGEEMVLETTDFEYTDSAGLDQEKHLVTLVGIDALRCRCGVAPRIPNIDGLHYTLGLALIRDEAPLDGSAVRFLRKTLGMTQSEFASTFEISPQHYSNWERGVGALPKKATRVAAAMTFLTRLLDREEAMINMSREFVIDTLKRVVSRTIDDASLRREAKIAVDLEDCPAAWLIQELDRVPNGHSGDTRC